MKLIFRKIADYIRECDKLLYVLCLVTTLFGCVAVLSTTYFVNDSAGDFLMQLFSLGLGLIAVIVISNFNYNAKDIKGCSRLSYSNNSSNINS